MILGVKNLKDKILRCKKRGLIYDFILKYPGLHFRELSRKLNIPKTTLEYHLRFLKKHRRVISERDVKYIRFYGINNVGECDKKLLSVLRQDIPFKIVNFLFLSPESSQKQICDYLERDPATISYHLEKLIKLDLVKVNPNGNNMEYKIKNHENVRDLFIKYKGFF